jgi:hypothetical protein
VHQSRRPLVLIAVLTAPVWVTGSGAALADVQYRASAYSNPLSDYLLYMLAVLLLVLALVPVLR